MENVGQEEGPRPQLMTMKLRGISAIVGGAFLAAAAQAAAVPNFVSGYRGRSHAESQAQNGVSQPKYLSSQAFTFFPSNDHLRKGVADEFVQKPKVVNLQSQIEMTVSKLSLYKGRGTRTSRFVYAAVSTIGVMGMFSAIVGAMLGVWLDEACDDGDDEDGFAYWDDGEWDTEGDLGWEREEHYAGMREVGCLLYSSF